MREVIRKQRGEKEIDERNRETEVELRERDRDGVSERERGG